MNKIPTQVETGTLGELLVQIRLLQYGVQAAPPIKDSGNDLIAIKGEVFRAIQVKTTSSPRFSTRRLPVSYHILAVVQLKRRDNQIELDQSKVFLIPKNAVPASPRRIDKLGDYEISQNRVDGLFQS